MRSILPGRPSSSRQALCTVNWDGLRLVAYVSGTTLIIFNGRRNILQSISVDDAAPLLFLCIEEQSGHIAVSDGSVVFVYKPLGRDYGDLRWTRVHTLPKEDEQCITYLSWGSPEELLVAGRQLTLWSFTDDLNHQVIWCSDISSPLQTAVFAPDGGLIASCGHRDRIIKIWRRLSYEQDSTRFDVSYLPHPAAVTDVTWRTYWHKEQNLDNLLYTQCADNKVRIWAHSDPHAYDLLQRVITIDASASIQPRRLSTGSISKSRYSFMIQSKDIARAAERALQVSRSGIDHALEHLVEVANRSPEVCIVLDGLGHMSAWGIENVGLKNRLPPEKFNVALVDGVEINLPPLAQKDDYAHVLAFANNDAAASLCLLVHSHSGKIDWYEGSFVDFFNTAARASRVSLRASWSGHDTSVESMWPDADKTSFLSSTETGQAIVWIQSTTGALIRQSQFHPDMAILDIALVRGNEFAIVLHPNHLSFWDLRHAQGRMLVHTKLSRKDAKSVKYVANGEVIHADAVLVLYDDCVLERWSMKFPLSSRDHSTNETGELLCLDEEIIVPKEQQATILDFCTGWLPRLWSYSNAGEVNVFSAQLQEGSSKSNLASTTSMYIDTSVVASILDAEAIAMVHSDNRTLSIWNIYQASWELVYQFPKSDEVEALYWHKKPGGQLLLAVQFLYSFTIFVQSSYCSDASLNPWKIHVNISTRMQSNHPIGTLCWIEPDQIAAGLGNQIVTYSIEEEASSISPQEQTNGIPPRTMADLPHGRGVLPCFAPEILSRQIQVGRLAEAKSMLHLLYDELKFLSQDEEVSVDLEETLSSLISKEQAIDTFELEETRLQFEDFISKVSNRQLSASRQRSLKQVVGNILVMEQSQRSLDASAITYLCHFLEALSNIDKDTGLPTLPYSAIVHAALSETQEALVNFVLARIDESGLKLTWATARALGLFLFVSDTEALRVHFENVARNEYNRNSEDRSPVDCSLYYLALDKKIILQSLWRRTIGVIEKENTMKLLARDFKEPRWKSTALKNAYALMSRRRFGYAAAFFLLGGSLQDAVNVCVNQMQDMQLAIAIARVWHGSEADRNTVMANLIESNIPELAMDSHEARWMMIWGCIQRREWLRALICIVQPVDRLFHQRFQTRKANESDERRKQNVPFEAMNYKSNDPTMLVNLYLFLRTKLLKEGHWKNDVISPAAEQQFVMRCVNWYLRAGLDWLALQLVATWEFVEWQETAPEKVENGIQDNVSTKESTQKSTLDDWLEPNPTKPNELGEEKAKPKPPPTQFTEPSADSLLDSFGF